MAIINITCTPVLDPRGKPFIQLFDNGIRMALVVLGIPTGSTYLTADKCALVHTGDKDFQKMYGASFIRQVMPSTWFATTGLASGKMSYEWNANTQKLQLFQNGHSGTTGINRAQITNGTALGADLQTAVAEIYFTG